MIYLFFFFFFCCCCSNCCVWQRSWSYMAIIASSHVSRSKFCAIQHFRSSIHSHGRHCRNCIWCNNWCCLFPTVGYRQVDCFIYCRGFPFSQKINISLAFFTEKIIWTNIFINFWNFFHFRLFSIKTSALRAGPLPFGAELPIRLVGKKSSQGIGLTLSPRDGSIFFSPFSETAIAEWNPKTNKQK